MRFTYFEDAVAINLVEKNQGSPRVLRETNHPVFKDSGYHEQVMGNTLLLLRVLSVRVEQQPGAHASVPLNVHDVRVHIYELQQNR